MRKPQESFSEPLTVSGLGTGLWVLWERRKLGASAILQWSEKPF
jgi:hypothetical protein